MDVAILLDGDFVRRMLHRRLGRSAEVSDIEALCKSVLHPGESMFRAIFYDCPPFAEIRSLPVSKKPHDFSRTCIFRMATSFQSSLKKNQFFTYRSGHLSFDGWKLKEAALARQIIHPCPLNDSDFDPVLTQKQVDMKIGLDVAKLSMKKSVDRILLLTSDADFIPAIDFARAKGVEVVLVTDMVAARRTQGTLKRSFTSTRIV